MIIGVNNGNYQNAYFYFNAIDPTYIDTAGTHWLIYGSWHSGIAAVKVNPEQADALKRANPLHLGVVRTIYGKQLWQAHSFENAEQPLAGF